MAEDIKQEMNETPGCIPTKWTRTTVADGDWLQENTIKPLSSRDNFLADKLSAASVDLDALSAAIDTVSSISDTKDTFLSGSIDYVSATLDSFSAKVETSAKSLYDSISAESDARRRGDEDLQGKINVLEAANDVIMVYGTHEEFVAGSASLHLTDKDVIKVLFDDTVSSNQVYYEYTLSTNSWDKIGELDPYYSKAEIESFSANLSATIANTYLSANGTDISAGKNLDVVIQSNNPRVAFKTKDDVSFSNVSATGFSGTNLSGLNQYDTIDNLFSSAQNGQDAYDKVSTAYWSAYKDSTHSGSGKLSANFSISAGENLDMEISDNIIKLNGKPAGVIHDDNLSGLGVQGDLLGLNSAVNVYVPAVQDQNFSANVQIGYTPNNLPFDGFYQRDYVGVALNRKHPVLDDDVGFQLDELGLHLNSIYSPDQSTITSYSSHFTMYEYFALNSAYWNIRFKNITAFDVNGTEKPIRLSELKLSAGQGLSFKMSDYSDWSGPALWVPPGVTVPNTSGYRNLTLSINDSIITSADHGQVAYETLGSAKISANSSPAFTGLLSNGFRISAGNNLIITTTSNNTIQLNAKPTGLTSISAGGNGNVNKNYTDNLSLSATSPVKFVTAAGNVLGVGVESATLQAGQGISFYKAGTNILGISADAQSPEPGRCIEIGADNSINLSSTISADNIIMTGVDVSTNVSAYYSPSGIHLLRAGRPGPEVYLTPSEVSSIVPDGHMGSITSTISWDAIINSHYVSAATPPLTFSSAPPNIVPSEMIDNVIYLI